MKKSVALIFLLSFLYGFEMFSVKRSGCLTSPDMVPCPADPCYYERRQGCGGFPSADCIPNYCGGCKAEWYVDGQLVVCDSTSPSSGPFSARAK